MFNVKFEEWNSWEDYLNFKEKDGVIYLRFFSDSEVIWAEELHEEQIRGIMSWANVLYYELKSVFTPVETYCHETENFSITVGNNNYRKFVWLKLKDVEWSLELGENETRRLVNMCVDALKNKGE